MADRRRRPIVVEGLTHAGGAFPIAVRAGEFVYSSAIHGKEPATGEIADTVEGQAVQAFANVRAVLEAAGASPADVVKVVVFAKDPTATRPALATPWAEMFPDENDRPVRHTVGADLPANLLVQVEFVAVVSEAEGE